MRRLSLFIVLSSIALSALCTSIIPSHRKTLSFGPRLRHAKFVTTPWSPQPPLDDPHEVAFALASRLHPRAEYHLRDDSYTDTLSGISHIYLQQHINRLTVVNGKLNMNIKDGVVLSYGESFYNDTQSETVTAPIDVHAEYCSYFERHLSQQSAFPMQVLLSADDARREEVASAKVQGDTCARFGLASLLPPRAFIDLGAATVFFMMHATPEDDLATSIATNFDAYVGRTTIIEHPRTEATRWSHAVHNVPDTMEAVEARLALIQTSSPNVIEFNQVWELLVHMQHNTYEVAVSTTYPPQIMSVIDRVSDSGPYASQEATWPRITGPHTYRVFEWGVNDPDSGTRTSVTAVPDRVSSPLGWHSVPITHMPDAFTMFSAGAPRSPNDWDTTIGNNVFVQEWWDKWERPLLERYRPVSSSDWPTLTFDYPYAPKRQHDRRCEARHHINATITQLWYTANMAHDLFYHYGFDETAGNFQQYNFGRGGKEHDAIILNAQDYTGYNGSTFKNNPDGQNPICKIYLWGAESGTVPYNDGAFEADIVLHELTHGLSGRLVGGPSDVTCLVLGEAGGLSEGWSDFLTLVVRAREVYEDLAMGAWASGHLAGIRKSVYSLNSTINPTVYSYLDYPDYATSVHGMGEVWATMLWGILHRLIRIHGLSSSLFPLDDTSFYRPAGGGRSIPRHGNTLTLQIVIDSMKLLPCNPTFIDARDAMIQADEHLTGGENTCEIWRGFAERGLGKAAHVKHQYQVGGIFDIHVDDFSVPSTCQRV